MRVHHLERLGIPLDELRQCEVVLLCRLVETEFSHGRLSLPRPGASLPSPCFLLAKSSRGGLEAIHSPGDPRAHFASTERMPGSVFDDDYLEVILFPTWATQARPQIGPVLPPTAWSNSILCEMEDPGGDGRQIAALRPPPNEARRRGWLVAWILDCV